MPASVHTLRKSAQLNPWIIEKIKSNMEIANGSSVKTWKSPEKKELKSFSKKNKARQQPLSNPEASSRGGSCGGHLNDFRRCSHKKGKQKYWKEKVPQQALRWPHSQFHRAL